MNKISVIIPCHISHTNNVTYLLDELVTKQTIKPYEVVIIVNPGKGEVHFQDKEAGTHIKIIGMADKCTPGKARNIGAQISSGDILVFADADDRYHPQRIELIEKCFLNETSDAVVHGFSFNDFSFLEDAVDSDKVSIRECEIDPAHTTNLRVKGSDFELHHGHASFKKEIFSELKYDEVMIPGEDGEFLRRLLDNKKKVNCVQEKLSSWLPTASYTL